MTDVIYTIYLWCITWIIYTFNVATRISIALFKNDNVDFDMSELKWIVASLMFFRFFLYTFFWIFTRLTLFRHNSIVTWIILSIGASRTVHTCRTAASHTILSFLILLFAFYDPQSHKILQFYCVQILLSKEAE